MRKSTMWFPTRSVQAQKMASMVKLQFYYMKVGYEPAMRRYTFQGTAQKEANLTSIMSHNVLSKSKNISLFFFSTDFFLYFFQFSQLQKNLYIWHGHFFVISILPFP